MIMIEEGLKPTEILKENKTSIKQLPLAYPIRFFDHLEAAT